MNTIGLYIKSHIFKSTTSAVNLAHKKNSNKNISFAMKLISVKSSFCNSFITGESKIDKYKYLTNKLSADVDGKYNSQQDVHPDNAGSSPIVIELNCKLSINDLVIRKDINIVYRVDKRAPEEIAKHGFTPYEKSKLGPAAELLKGKAWCAGECLSETILHNGKKKVIEPKLVFNELKSPASANILHDWYIYKVNTKDIPVVRYIDNIDTPYKPGAFHVYTHPKLFDVKEPHSITEEDYLTFRNKNNEKINLDTPNRLNHRATYGETYVIGSVSADKIEYGGRADNPRTSWEKLKNNI